MLSNTYILHKVLSLLEACFDLILTFHENLNHGRENYCKSGVQIPPAEGQKIVKNKDMQFFMENMKMKRKKESQIFSFFPPMI